MLMVEPAPDVAAAEAAPDVAAEAAPDDRSAARTPMPEELHRMIAEAAYYLAERRGFEPGHEIDDWLTAKAQVFDSIGAR